MESPNLRIVSLGAGVQSTAVILMALHGEFSGPLPDFAIFSDTGWEPKAVYDHLDWLEREVAGRIPILRVSNGNIREDLISHAQNETRIANPPLFVRNAQGTDGILRRGCTTEYKVQPITEKTKELLGVAPGKRVPKGTVVERWFGISMDEVHRMKPAPSKWERHRYPLIERGYDRTKCLMWMDEHGYPRPPKSACVGCPYRSDHMWRQMRDNSPQEWAEAVEMDKLLRGGMRGVNGEVYFHRSLVPLDEVDLRTRRERGQLTFFDDDDDGFGNECEGHCGV